MAIYRKVSTRIWNDERFMSLPDTSKFVFLFLLTHPNMTSIGAMRGTIPGLAAELSWPEKDFRAALAHLERPELPEQESGKGVAPERQESGKGAAPERQESGTRAAPERHPSGKLSASLPKTREKLGSKLAASLGHNRGLVICDEKANFIWLPNFLKYNRPENQHVLKTWESSLDMLPECELRNLLIDEIKEIKRRLRQESGKGAAPERQGSGTRAAPERHPDQEQEQEQDKDKTPPTPLLGGRPPQHFTRFQKKRIAEGLCPQCGNDPRGCFHNGTCRCGRSLDNSKKCSCGEISAKCQCAKKK